MIQFFKRLLVYVVCFFSFNACANDAIIFAQAHKLYNQNHFAQALELYDTIKHKDAATWYNMGNSAYMSADYAHARVYWRRVALATTSWRLLNDSANNLRLLDSVQGIEKPESSFAFLHRLVSMIPVRTLQFLFLLLWILFFLALVCTGYIRKARIPLGVCVIAVAMMVTIRYTTTLRHVGVVMVTEATLFAGPDENYHVLAQLAQAREITLESVDERWCKVSSEHGVGWVKREAITIV